MGHVEYISSTKPELREVLEKAKGNNNIESFAIISRDGILLASYLDQMVHSETYAIMEATKLGSAITAQSELNMDMPKAVIVESDSGKDITLGAGTNALISAYVPNGASKDAYEALQGLAEKVKQIIG